MVTRTYRSTPHWQQWVSWVTPSLRRSRRQPRTMRQRRTFLYPLVGLGGALLLWQTDSQLLLATLSGVGTVWLLARWQRLLYEYAQHLKTQVAQAAQHPLGATVAAGAIACLGTYTLTHLWQGATDHWLVIALVLQGALLLALLTVLIWVAAQQQQQQLQRWLQELSHANPLHRLIAIRQLSRLVDRGDRQCAQEALYLLLNQETEPLVRRAALSVLDQLDDTP
ncbi:hypothetical protein [Parathermosynechococcus lividus]